MSFFFTSALNTRKVPKSSSVSETSSGVNSSSSEEVIVQRTQYKEIYINNFKFTEEENKKIVLAVSVTHVNIRQGEGPGNTAFLKGLSMDFFSEDKLDKKRYFAPANSEKPLIGMSRKATDVLLTQFDSDKIIFEDIVIRFHKNNYVLSVLLGDKGTIDRDSSGLVLAGNVNFLDYQGKRLSSERLLWTSADDNFHITGSFSLYRGVQVKKGKALVVDHLLNEVRTQGAGQTGKTLTL